MKIELFTIQDYNEVYELWLKTPGMGLNSIDDTKEGIARYVERNPKSCFIARVNNVIIGVILAGHDGRRGFIYHLSVAQDFQKKGVGKALVDSAIEALKKEGIQKIALVVYRKNKKGNRFWEKRGFSRRKDLVYRNKTIADQELVIIDT